MTDKDICVGCEHDCDEPCNAYRRLLETYRLKRISDKNRSIGRLKRELDLIDSQPSVELKKLADRIIKRFTCFEHINLYDIRIGFVNNENYKRPGGRTVYADTVKVSDTYKPWLPYDFIITFYGDSDTLTENQRKVLMYHELKHVGIGQKGLKIVQHDVEDFKIILDEHGIDWSSPFITDDLKDILRSE